MCGQKFGQLCHTEKRFLVTVTSLSAHKLENLSSLASDCALKFATIGARTILEGLLGQEGQQWRFERKAQGQERADAYNLDSTKTADAEPEVEVGGFDMDYLNLDAVEVQESEWIKIGVDTGAGKTAWPQGVTYGKTIPGSLSAQQLESLSSLASDCLSKVAMIGESFSEFEVFKRQYASHCYRLESTRRLAELQFCTVTEVTCSTEARTLRRNLMRGSGRR